MCAPKSNLGAPSACGGKCGVSCFHGKTVAASSEAPDVTEVPEAASELHSPEAQRGVASGRREMPSLDKVTSFGATGQGLVIYPAHAPGPFYSARAAAGMLLVVLYLALPWIPIGGAPAVFLNVAERRFHLFGLTFLTQDLWLGFFLVSGLGFGLFTLTAVLGRVWCGWACPLTVFLDVVRRVERWIEGDALTRKRLDGEPWTLWMGLRRAFKNGVVLLLATVVAHAFLAYFVSIPGLFQMMRTAPSEHLSAFLLVSGTTALLWFCFGWFREQFCIVLCPYGRLQSVLTDEHTLVIGYDATRGEPRGKVQVGAGAGDCVDCMRCVQVCPTGIDIRQGLQLECIGCAACVDACDTVMRKVHRPSGLIRYDSLAGLSGQKRKLWRPRLALYGGLMMAGLAAASVAVSTLRSAVVSLTRLPGAPYFVQGEVLRNQFLLRVLNKQPSATVFTLELEGKQAEGLALQGELHEQVEGWSEGQMTIVLTVPLKHWSEGGPLKLLVREAGGKVVASKTLCVMGPDFSAQTPRATAAVPVTGDNP